MNYQIVPITEDHIVGYCAAVDSVARERKYLAFLEGPPYQQSYDFVMENMQKKLPHLVAICENNVIGWCDIASLHRPIFEHAGGLGIGIISGYRRLGIGEKMMRMALEKASQRGLTRVELTVRAPNIPALTLYKKLGFLVEGVKRRGVLIDGQYEDLIMMAILL
jgi:ribosomal protein S18 acetylase RimI-like enzyme